MAQDYQYKQSAKMTSAWPEARAPDTFDLFKSSLRNHFVPQNYKDTAYRRYKTLCQGTLSVLDYSIQLKTVADQAGDLVSAGALHIDFVQGLHDKIKPFIVAQPAIPNETWESLVGHALRQEETLPVGYNAGSKATPQSEVVQRTSTSSPRSPSNRTSNWKSRSPRSTSAGSKPFSPRKSLDPLSDAERDFLKKHEGCYRCRRTYAGHIALDCPGVGTSGSSGSPRAMNVKKEEVSTLDGYVASPVQSDAESDSYSSVPIITIPIRIQQAVVESGVDPGASINVISPRMVKERNLTEQPATPLKIHQALDP